MSVSFTTTTPDAAATAYAAADRAGKSAIRAAADRAVMDAVRSGDMVAAAAWVAVRDSMSTVRESAPVDYASFVHNYAATLAGALDVITTIGVVAPDGETYIGSVDAGTSDVDAAARLARVTFRKSGRGNVADYVDAVLPSDVAWTATDVHNAWTADRADDFASMGYADGPPSVGAIGAFMRRDSAETGPASIGATVDSTGKWTITRDA